MNPLFIIGLFLVNFILSCTGIPSEANVPKQNQEKSPLSQAQAFIETKEYTKALEIARNFSQENPSHAEGHYTLGNIYTLLGDNSNAILHYQKALENNPLYHESYTSLKNIYRLNLLNIRKNIEDALQKKLQAKKEGSEQIKELQKHWASLLYEKAKLHISEATTYLLYQEKNSNISEFPELEAHLRDVQDSIKEIEEGKSRQPLKSKDIKEALYHEIHTKRSNIAKKHARILVDSSQEWYSTKSMQKSIDALKDADAQIAKFYKEEDPTSEVFLLTFDDEVLSLSQKIYSKLLENYESSLEISFRNRKHFQEIEEWQQAEDESKFMEQILESMTQAQVNSLWRYEKIKKEEAEHHSSMIPLYEKFLFYVPESGKIGEYHYRLAHCYHKNNNKEKALEHARKAVQIMDTYQSKEFLKSLES